MLMLVFLLCFFTFTTIVLTILYFRQTEATKLDHMSLKNLLTDEERDYYINEYKKNLTAQFVFEHMAEEQDRIEIAREIIKNGRNK